VYGVLATPAARLHATPRATGEQQKQEIVQMQQMIKDFGARSARNPYKSAP
jgi:hypothetical protein